MGAYRLAPAPHASGLRSFDCSFCHHEDLARPVFLTDGSGVIAAGSGCAARVLGSTWRSVERDAARLTHQAENVAALVADRRVRYSAALDEFETYLDTPSHEHPVDGPNLAACRTTYLRSGGYSVLGSLHLFLEHVAETGQFPERFPA